MQALNSSNSFKKHAWHQSLASRSVPLKRKDALERLMKRRGRRWRRRRRRRRRRGRRIRKRRREEERTLASCEETYVAKTPSMRSQPRSSNYFFAWHFYDPCQCLDGVPKNTLISTSSPESESIAFLRFDFLRFDGVSFDGVTFDGVMDTLRDDLFPGLAWVLSCADRATRPESGYSNAISIGSDHRLEQGVDACCDVLNTISVGSST
mmetsp:Transcript_98595/g.155820  ORF Transcript_98595/g.155820 Transcript_98595/m.155820 type:complete len:208 (+) Transcript_98595:45-668(+)